MKAILIGCEYAGTSTLAQGLVKWSNKLMGQGKGLWGYHDHWTIPDTPAIGNWTKRTSTPRRNRNRSWP